MALAPAVAAALKGLSKIWGGSTWIDSPSDTNTRMTWSLRVYSRCDLSWLNIASSLKTSFLPVKYVFLLYS